MKKDQMLRESLELALQGDQVTVVAFDYAHSNHLYHVAGNRAPKEELYRKRPNYLHFLSGGKITFLPQGGEEKTNGVIYLLTKANYGDDEWEPKGRFNRVLG
jgi:hypothetical protein